jgi:hypothetical protein
MNLVLQRRVSVKAQLTAATSEAIGDLRELLVEEDLLLPDCRT